MKHHIIFAFFCGTVITAHAWNASENAIWIEGNLKGKLSETLAVKLTEQVRYRDEGKFYFYRYTDFGLSWKFAKNWSLAPGYRYITARKNPTSNWISKPLWRLDLKNETTVSVIDFSSRLRLTYVALDHARDVIDFCPKFTLLLSKAWTSWKLRPYIADEMMYNFEANNIYRNRISGGIKCAPWAKVSIDLFLIHERTEIALNNEWNESYNMGACIGLNF